MSATPPTAVGVAECPTDRESRYALRIWSETDTVASGPGRGEVTIEKGIANYQRGPADLWVTACGDMSDYRDSTVTLAFKASSLQTPAGRIADGPPVVIQILNDDAPPSVSLSTASLTIDEGMTQTVAIASRRADLAGAVMRVGVQRHRRRADLALAGRPQGLRTSGRRHSTPWTLGEQYAISKLTIRADEDERPGRRSNEDGHGDDCGRRAVPISARKIG